MTDNKEKLFEKLRSKKARVLQSNSSLYLGSDAIVSKFYFQPRYGMQTKYFLNMYKTHAHFSTRSSLLLLFSVKARASQDMEHGSYMQLPYAGLATEELRQSLYEQHLTLQKLNAVKPLHFLNILYFYFPPEHKTSPRCL